MIACSNCKIIIQEELELLNRLAAILADNKLAIDDALQRVLSTMSRSLEFPRSFLTLYNRQSGQIFISKSFGLTDTEHNRGVYSPGEGITGKVIESGEPFVVQNIEKEKGFLNRIKIPNEDGKTISFICVPVKSGQEVIGTLSSYQKDLSDFQRDLRLLNIVASMISQAAQLYLSRHEEYENLQAENLRLHKELEDNFRPSNIIGSTSSMKSVYELIDRVKDTATTALILGESGVGKELVASAIHYSSPRKDHAFIKVNCAALPESLMESELFGHEKGSFTGADSRRIGKFEAAHKGSIFLDEIGEISFGTQAKLLRILQEREFVRVGGNETLYADVRVIAATNRDLEKLVSQGDFREDLYYRLNIIPITVPPLRERRSDILQLANAFIEKHSKLNGKSVKRISTPAIDMLMAYHWPGNVRELENCIERAVVLSNDEVIHGYNLPPTLQIAAPETVFSDRNGSLQKALDALEYEMIIEAVKACRGNLSKVAEKLGLTIRMMGLRAKKYNIDLKAFKREAREESKN
jgi:Nif-specific regulatory protein